MDMTTQIHRKPEDTSVYQNGQDHMVIVAVIVWQLWLWTYGSCGLEFT